jgi:hypothetical protein
MILGVLPASGKASRLSGIPKFCLPINDNQTLLEWHVNKMKEVCDDVRISTREMWLPIVERLNLDVEIVIVEPSSMADAILKTSNNKSDNIIVGMPDTFILKSKDNFYGRMIEKDSPVVLASWECDKFLKGRVGQIELSGDRVLSIVDKDENCPFERMWGAIYLNGTVGLLDPKQDVIGDQFNSWIRDGVVTTHVPCSGNYVDAGNFIGLKRMYSEL